MHDHWLIAIAIAVSGAGIALLLIALLVVEPEELSAEGLANAPEGAALMIRGTVLGVRAQGNSTIIDLEQRSSTGIVIEDAVDLGPGSCIVVIGKKHSFGAAQIAATRIKEC